MTVTREDLKAVLGDLDDDRVLAILALNPTPVELEQAAVWAAGDGDILGKRGRPQNKIVAEIVDILMADEDEPQITGSAHRPVLPEPRAIAAAARGSGRGSPSGGS